MKDSEIDYTDAPATNEEFWKEAIVNIPPTKVPVTILTFPVIFLFERSPNFPLSQSPILSLSIIIKSSLLATAKSLKPLFCRRFQT